MSTRLPLPPGFAATRIPTHAVNGRMLLLHPIATPGAVFGPTAEQRPPVRIAAVRGLRPSSSFLKTSFQSRVSKDRPGPSRQSLRTRGVQTIRATPALLASPEPIAPMMIHQMLRRLRYLPHTMVGSGLSRRHIYEDCSYGSVATER
ncbi:hypothetical protein MMC14_004836 [Varicellaria rhodocarpa]|nr:hypothetical protein [Varicellaria rhodocarpa]